MLKSFKMNMFGLFIVSLLSACSYSPTLVKEAYADLATDLSDGIKESVTLSPKQSIGIDDYTKQLMYWHRRNKLPDYSRSFSQLAYQIQKGQLTQQSLNQFFTKLDGLPHFNEATHLTAKVAVLARTLNESQISQLERSFKEEYNDAVKEIRKTNNAKSESEDIKGGFKFISITLNNKQMKLVEEETKKLHDTRWQELKKGKMNGQAMIRLLREKNSPDFVKRFVKIWNSTDLRLSKDLKEKQNDRVINQLIFKLVQSFSPDQRKKLVSQLFSISKTFNELSKEG